MSNATIVNQAEQKINNLLKGQTTITEDLKTEIIDVIYELKRNLNNPYELIQVFTPWIEAVKNFKLRYPKTYATFQNIIGINFFKLHKWAKPKPAHQTALPAVNKTPGKQNRIRQSCQKSVQPPPVKTVRQSGASMKTIHIPIEEDSINSAMANINTMLQNMDKYNKTQFKQELSKNYIQLLNAIYAPVSYFRHNPVLSNRVAHHDQKYQDCLQAFNEGLNKDLLVWSEKSPVQFFSPATWRQKKEQVDINIKGMLLLLHEIMQLDNNIQESINYLKITNVVYQVCNNLEQQLRDLYRSYGYDV